MRISSIFASVSGPGLTYLVLTKPLPKLTITTPPFFATALSMSSVMLRGASVNARADEWEAITGASLVSIASQKVLSATCEMSTVARVTFWAYPILFQFFWRHDRYGATMNGLLKSRGAY